MVSVVPSESSIDNVEFTAVPVLKIGLERVTTFLVIGEFGDGVTEKNEFVVLKSRAHLEATVKIAEVGNLGNFKPNL